MYQKQLLVDWIGGRGSINTAWVRQKLQIPYTASEVEAQRQAKEAKERQRAQAQLEAGIRERQRQLAEAQRHEQRTAALAEQIRAESEQRAAQLAPAQESHRATSAEQLVQPTDQVEAVGQREAAIRRIVEERGIKHLMHFTRVENLPGIRERGLWSRATLGNDGCVWNDDWRRDKRPHAICLSVSYPNYKMFYDYRLRKGGGWAVLLLDPCLLWERDCGFVEVNAASSDVWTRPEDELKTVAAFERMFGSTAVLRT